MKKWIALIMALCLLSSLLLSGCGKQQEDSDSWKKEIYDLSLPVLGQDGWYLVFEDQFNGDGLNQGIQFGEQYTGSHEIWTTSPHAIRWESNDADRPEQGCWWCPDMVQVRDGKVEIHARYDAAHDCGGDCPASGRFTGGIETRRIVGDNNSNKGSNDEILFGQAFGYFETRVKFPDADGLWSAFWLQSSNQRKVASEGVDGTEIDVFESAFRKSSDGTKMGHALLWNGYGEFAKSEGSIRELGKDLYDGYHTFALKWTPEYYVFYIDGEPTWASMGGGVSKVQEFLRLTVEIDAGDESGPHGQDIGKFDETSESIFYVDYVKVWQNENYTPYQIDDAKFPGELDLAN